MKRQIAIWGLVLGLLVGGCATTSEQIDAVEELMENDALEALIP